jgi:hypothetical protein
MKILNNCAILLIISFFTISTSQAKSKTEWYKTFDNESATFYVDTYMLIYENGYRMFWLVEDLKKPFLKKYNSILKYKFLDCKGNRSKTFQSFAYEQKMAEGRESLKLPNDASWLDNTKDLSMLSSSNQICNDPYLLSKTRGLK